MTGTARLGRAAAAARGAALGALRCGALASLGFLAGCDGKAAEPQRTGDPAIGVVTVERQACGSCHVIPGVANADGLAGPSLDHFASRRMVAGLLPNTPSELVRWLRSPQAVLKGNAMPDMGLSERQGRDVAAFLETLK